MPQLRLGPKLLLCKAGTHLYHQTCCFVLVHREAVLVRKFHLCIDSTQVRGTLTNIVRGICQSGFSCDAMRRDDILVCCSNAMDATAEDIPTWANDLEWS